ncbi:50S ribosomal protein L29 [Blochmannia endosymbiont of Colobopsis nipponica]|uniref:50S ribosomal protein L29 n=1 Tax=Blochmannia endosymbiont of Colobopsis nipponica TaxID=2681987 RepID=UPI00178778F7|nr:50S ribosomal protein L29 [Blochmannia endosymbiont of Colobopsis nipponica]QOI11216.1 50S ribosomal protein L29 [Blochmannia endosymbiont of Colobopsis nipponica]
MKLRKLHKKNVEELNFDLLNLLHTQINVRMQIRMGQVNQTHLLKEIRRNIARIKTYLSNKTRSYDV